MSLIPLPTTLIPFLKPYLPPPTTTTNTRSTPNDNDNDNNRPFVTLTYAQSLDSKIAAAPGLQTKLSHAETKTMTHYLRSKHDAILVGIGTVIADDPKLNCRYKSHQNEDEDEDDKDKDNGMFIRPIILDPNAKWKYETSQLCQICKQGLGIAPYLIIDENLNVSQETKKMIEIQGGKILKLSLKTNNKDKDKDKDNWKIILFKLYELGINSIMIEGGATIINDLLTLTTTTKNNKLIDSLIITIAPVFLGNSAVNVSPFNGGVKLKDIKWWTGIQDSVISSRIDYD